MGNLFLNNNSFELQHVARENRDLIFADFCKALDCSIQNQDDLFATSELKERQYSYGTFFYDFLYNSYDNINNNANLNGISSTTHQLYINIVFSIPGLVNMLESIDVFHARYNNMHFGYAGFKLLEPNEPYIYSYKSYQIWKCPWLSIHQNEIIWRNELDRFLPNREYSNTILKEEIAAHKKNAELKKRNDNVAITFHEEVMRHKGADIGTYAREIGKRVLEANYYCFDQQLTKAESAANHNRRRSIFRLTDSNGDFQYVSIDHGHGMFEFHNRKGEHLGEKKFDGSYNSGPEPDHNLRTL